MFLRISPIIFSPFIINRISSLDELLSFGEISFDTVEPLADRFLITYQRWSQMMSDKEEIEKKNGFSFVCTKRSINEMVMRTSSSYLAVIEKKRSEILPVDEASTRLLAVSWQANLTGWQSVVEVNSTRHFSTEEPLLNKNEKRNKNKRTFHVNGKPLRSRSKPVKFIQTARQGAVLLLYG